jgi:hypothetical protein
VDCASETLKYELSTDPFHDQSGTTTHQMLFGLVVASKIFLDSKIQMAIKRKNTKMQYFKVEDFYKNDQYVSLSRQSKAFSASDACYECLEC